MLMVGKSNFYIVGRAIGGDLGCLDYAKNRKFATYFTRRTVQNRLLNDRISMRSSTVHWNDPVKYLVITLDKTLTTFKSTADLVCFILF